MTFTATELNKRVSMQRFTTTRGPDGEVIEGWATFREAFAKMEPLVGREYFAAAEVQQENTVKFTMRHVADLTAADRLLCDGKTWNIRSVINVKGRNRETLVMAQTLE